MIALNENMGGRKNCTFSCCSSFYADALLNTLRRAGVDTYDSHFSDGALSFDVDADNYNNVKEFLNKIESDK